MATRKRPAGLIIAIFSATLVAGCDERPKITASVVPGTAPPHAPEEPCKNRPSDQEIVGAAASLAIKRPFLGMDGCDAYFASDNKGWRLRLMFLKGKWYLAQEQPMPITLIVSR